MDKQSQIIDDHLRLLEEHQVATVSQVAVLHQLGVVRLGQRLWTADHLVLGVHQSCRNLNHLRGDRRVAEDELLVEAGGGGHARCRVVDHHQGDQLVLGVLQLQAAVVHGSVRFVGEAGQLLEDVGRHAGGCVHQGRGEGVRLGHHQVHDAGLLEGLQESLLQGKKLIVVPFPLDGVEVGNVRVEDVSGEPFCVEEVLQRVEEAEDVDADDTRLQKLKLWIFVKIYKILLFWIENGNVSSDNAAPIVSLEEVLRKAQSVLHQRGKHSPGGRWV